MNTFIRIFNETLIGLLFFLILFIGFYYRGTLYLLITAEPLTAFLALLSSVAFLVICLAIGNAITETWEMLENQ